MWDWLIGAPYPLARKVIVNLKEGRAFSGVLWERRADFLVLRNAELRNPGAAPQPVDGEVLVFRADVSFIQVLVTAEVAR